MLKTKTLYFMESLYYIIDYKGPENLEVPTKNGK